MPAPDLTSFGARFLASGRARQPAGFSYLGPVFRLSRRPARAILLQAGNLIVLRQDRAARRNAEMLALAWKRPSACLIEGL